MPQSRGQQTFSVKRRIKMLGFVDPTVSFTDSILLLWYKSSHWQCVHGWAGLYAKLHSWSLKGEFHVTFSCCKYSLLYSQPFKNVKNVQSLQPYKSRWLARFLPGSQFANHLNNRNRVKANKAGDSWLALSCDSWARGVSSSPMMGAEII